MGESSQELTDVEGDSPSRPPVELSWGLDTSDGAVVKADSFRVTVKNLREDRVRVELSMHGMGLDQRTVQSRVGEYTLRGLETRVVTIKLKDLPVQSVGAPGQIDLVARCSGPTWKDIQLPATSAYVQYAPGYSKVFASTQSTWAPVALSLVDGDKSNPAYAELLDEPSRAVKARANGGDVLAEVDPGKAKDMYDKVVRPARHPKGRFVNDVGELVEVSGEAVGGGMLPLEPEQVALMESLDAYGTDDAEGGMQTMDFFPIYPGKTLRMCAKWGVQYIDSGLGEDYLNGTGYQQYPARYARSQIRQRSPTLKDHWAGYLDAEGCAPEMFLPYGTYSLVVTSEHKSPNNSQFRVTADQANQFWNWWLPFSVDIFSPSSTSLATSNHGASRIGAVVSLLLSNWDAGLKANTSYRLINSATDCSGVGAYSSSDKICYGNDPNGGPHTTTSKVTIAHEIGHSVDRDGAGIQNNNYDWEVVGAPLCRCDHVQWANRLHCIQSWEDASAAFVEGFAQFYAAKVFNEWRHTDCVFAYYKEFLNVNGTVTIPPVVMSCRTAKKWMKNHCDVTTHNGGVEMDWMTYFWNIHAPQEYGTKRISMAEYFNIKKVACTGSTAWPCNSSHKTDFQTFRNGALAYFGNDHYNVKYRHVRDMGDTHGVRNGNQ